MLSKMLDITKYIAIDNTKKNTYNREIIKNLLEITSTHQTQFELMSPKFTNSLFYYTHRIKS